MRTVERRKFQRVRLPHPIEGTIGRVRIFLLNAAMGGILVAHQDPAPAVGTACTLRFDWQGMTVLLQCSLIRTVSIRAARKASEKPLFHSGLQIQSNSPEAETTLREMIGHFVALALDEQKANARGIPAMAAQSFQTGKGVEFLRCDMVSKGRWSKTKTIHSDQPRDGFTVSAEEDPEEVERLCSSYETSDKAGRELIRTMAAMSISKAEGVPTRRYTP